jgi:hypothetical protein
MYPSHRLAISSAVVKAIHCILKVVTRKILSFLDCEISYVRQISRLSTINILTVVVLLVIIDEVVMCNEVVLCYGNIDEELFLALIPTLSDDGSGTF